MCDTTTHMCDMTHSYVWHASFICVSWLIHMCDMPDSHLWNYVFIRVAYLIHMCDMPHSHVWHASFTCVTCLIHMCDMPHSYLWHASFISVACAILINDKPHSHVWYVTYHTFDMSHSCVYTTNRCRICAMTHPYSQLQIGWQRFLRLGSILCRRIRILPMRFTLSTRSLLQLQVSFAKEPYKTDYILHKKFIILRSLLIVRWVPENKMVQGGEDP